MKRVTYISNFSRPLSAEELQSIADVSTANNSRDNLTGALFCFRNIFYQILEGDDHAVDRCFKRIGEDDRHEGVFVLNLERNVEERMYPEWSMKTVVLDENQDALVRPIKNLLDSLSRTHRIMEKYTSEFVRRSIEQGENPLLAVSEKTEALIIFSDIVASTSLAEYLPVEQVTPVLDTFYDAATVALMPAGGDILKLTGDGFMARFPADQADAALEAVLAFQRRLKSVRDTAPKDNPLSMLYAGVGMTHGSVLEGNIGSATRKDYTLLGDVVNTAARLEGVTRKVQRSVVIDEAVYNKLSESARAGCKKMGLYKPKGKTTHIPIYAPMDEVCILDEGSRTIQETLKQAALV